MVKYFYLKLNKRIFIYVNFLKESNKLKTKIVNFIFKNKNEKNKF